MEWNRTLFYIMRVWRWRRMEWDLREKEQRQTIQTTLKGPVNPRSFDSCSCLLTLYKYNMYSFSFQLHFFINLFSSSRPRTTTLSPPWNDHCNKRSKPQQVKSHHFIFSQELFRVELHNFTSRKQGERRLLRFKAGEEVTKNWRGERVRPWPLQNGWDLNVSDLITAQ